MKGYQIIALHDITIQLLVGLKLKNPSFNLAYYQTKLGCKYEE